MSTQYNRAACIMLSVGGCKMCLIPGVVCHHTPHIVCCSHLGSKVAEMMLLWYLVDSLVRKAPVVDIEDSYCMLQLSTVTTISYLVEYILGW